MLLVERQLRGRSYGLGRGLNLSYGFGASIYAGGESSEPSPEGLLGRMVELAGRGPVLVGIVQVASLIVRQ